MPCHAPKHMYYENNNNSYIYIYNYVVSVGTGITVTSNVTSNVASLDENVMLTYVDGGGGPSTFQWEFDGV